MQKQIRDLVESHSREFTAEVAMAGLGQRPLDACRSLVEAAKLPISAEEVLAWTGPRLAAQWGTARPLPGAHRFLDHLQRNGVRCALVRLLKVTAHRPRANILPLLL